MIAAAVVYELHIPDCHSLKEKRAVIRPILDGWRRRFQVSSAEVGAQDSWQRADLAVAVVGASVGHVDEVLAACDRFVWSFPEIEVVGTRRSWLEDEED
jgi:uncharacterized protein YlxP (DUF503 family)